MIKNKVIKNPPASTGDAGDMGLILWSERLPGVRNGNPFQYSCLENSWWAIVHWVAKNQT